MRVSQASNSNIMFVHDSFYIKDTFVRNNMIRLRKEASNQVFSTQKVAKEARAA